MEEKIIAEILRDNDGEDAIMEIDELLSDVFYSNPDDLTFEERNFIYIENLEREVNNGGFSQFFYNSAGDNTKETVKALELIGSKIFLSMLERAIKEFPNSEVPKERCTRQDILERIEEKATQAWDEIDQEFYNYEEDIYGMLIKYIENNIQSFR